MDGLNTRETSRNIRFTYKKTWRQVFPIGIGILLVSMVGCSSQEEEVVGVGSGIDELKESVCPCGDVFYRNGIWLS